MDNELFGEAHEQEENGLFGRIRQAEQLILSGVVKPSYCYCYEHSAKDEKCKTLCEDCKVYN